MEAELLAFIYRSILDPHYRSILDSHDRSDYELQDSFANYFSHCDVTELLLAGQKFVAKVTEAYPEDAHNGNLEKFNRNLDMFLKRLEPKREIRIQQIIDAIKSGKAVLLQRHLDDDITMKSRLHDCTLEQLIAKSGDTCALQIIRSRQLGFDEITENNISLIANTECDESRLDLLMETLGINNIDPILLFVRLRSRFNPITLALSHNNLLFTKKLLNINRNAAFALDGHNETAISMASKNPDSIQILYQSGFTDEQISDVREQLSAPIEELTPKYYLEKLARIADRIIKLRTERHKS